MRDLRCARSRVRSLVTSHPSFNFSPFCVALTSFKFPLKRSILSLRHPINDRHTKTFESSVLSNVPPISCYPNFLLFLFLRSVAFWDIRNVKGAKSKLSSLHRTRVVTSAYFSPLTGSQVLVTSSDDYVT